MAKLVLIFSLVSALICAAFCQCTFDTAEKFYKRSVYEFSTELMKRLTQEKDNHFVTSPFSAWAVLSTMFLGADGRTKEELARILRLHPHQCFTNKFYQEIRTAITAAHDGILAESCSAIFIDERLQVKADFLESISKTGIVDLEEHSFENYVDIAGIINDYVRKGTDGAISDLISPDDLHGIYIVLVDALYFRGTWRIQFDPINTEPSQFYDINDVPIGDVELMYVTDYFNCTYVSQIEADVLELPYGADSGYSMLFFLPNTNVTILDLVQSLKRVSLSGIFYALSDPATSSSKTTVQIPKFQMTTELDNLKELLIDMGLETVFDPNRAEFPFISDSFGGVFVSNLIQKATIEISEEGTTASAATVAEFEFKSAANSFVANKPFLYMLVHKPSNIPIFSGAFSNPSNFS